jgi:sulfonate transport system substrate-binding protein
MRTSVLREDDIRARRYAISRRGSGSHLMSFAHARARGWPVESLEFVEVGTLQGAVNAFREGSADVFFWEKFMTKPLVEAGEFRRVGEFSAPWPAFVVCVELQCWAQHGERVERIVAEALLQASKFKSAAGSAARIEQAYGLSAADAREWLELTEWSKSVSVDPAMLAETADVIVAAGAIERPPVIVPLPRQRR